MFTTLRVQLQSCSTLRRMKLWSIILSLFFSLCASLFLSAQTNDAGFFNRSWQMPDRIPEAAGVDAHGVFYPLTKGLDSTLTNWMLGKKLSPENAIRICLSPIYNISGGANNQRGLYDAQAGLNLRLGYSNHFQGDLTYVFNALSPPDYIKDYFNTHHVIPSVGFALKQNNGLYYAHVAQVRLAYLAGKHFEFELGNGKNFWGNGYRSLVLGDATSNYPYFRITAKVGKVKFTSLWAQLRDFSATGKWSDAALKYVSMHGLSWNVSKKFSLSFFEMVTWQDRDSLSRRNFDLNYLNPVVFFRPVEYAQGSADNVLLGGGFSFHPSSHFQLYGQVILDEFLLSEIKANRGWWGNKFGGQLGWRWTNAFTDGLHFQMEANAVRPFTYSHASSLQAWGGMGQPLAHPLGNNFRELIGMARFTKLAHWDFSGKAILAQFGKDPQGLNLGGNIFQSYKSPDKIYGNAITQGEKHTLLFVEASVSRKFESMSVFLTARFRADKTYNLGVDREPMIWLGISSNMISRPVQDF